MSLISVKWRKLWVENTGKKTRVNTNKLFLTFGEIILLCDEKQIKHGNSYVRLTMVYQENARDGKYFANGMKGMLKRERKYIKKRVGENKTEII